MAIVTVLGAGSCHLEQNTRPSGHAPPGFFIRWGEGDANLLVECSPGITERLERFCQVYARDIAAVFVSRLHPMHCAIGELIHEISESIMQPHLRRMTRPGTPVLSTERIADQLFELACLQLGDYWEADAPAPRPEIRGVAEGIPFILPGNARLTVFGDVIGERGVPSAGFRLTLPEGVIAYSGDVSLADDDGLLRLSEDADLFICEASLELGDSEGERRHGHLTPESAAEIARGSGVKTLLLTHLSRRVQIADIENALHEFGFETGKNLGFAREQLVLHVPR